MRQNVVLKYSRGTCFCRKGPLPFLSAFYILGLTAWLFFLTAPVARGQQSVTLRAQPVRITVPVNSTTTNTALIHVTIAEGSDLVNLSVTGLPPGAEASLDVTSFTESGTASLTLNTENVTQGEYDLAIEASGGASYRLPLPLIVRYVWSGAVETSFSSRRNWMGNIAPIATDHVFFGNPGGKPDDSVTGVVIDSDAEIASLRFGQDTGGSRYHNIEIPAGRLLSVTGTGGFSFLRDGIHVAQKMDVNFSGGGTLEVRNPEANIALLIDAQQVSTLDMDQLDTFIADVNRVGLGDYRLYPNYDTNGYLSGGTSLESKPARFIPTVRLARNNVITAAHVDPNDYMDPSIRDYSLTLGNNETQGTSQKAVLNFGLSNSFFMDSICLVQSGGQANSSGNIAFNPAFFGGGPTAYFRGPDGATNPENRMSVFAIADAAGNGPSGSGVKALVDLSGGRIDALVDRLYVARDRLISSDNASSEATLTIADGVLDVNTAILGFQGNGNNPNTDGNDLRGHTRGVVNVNQSAVFVVNDTLELGHTTADAGDVRQAEEGYGKLNINDGGTVMANTITVGGVTKVSQDNIISLNNGSTLVVSNSVAGPEKRLMAMNMSDSTLTLHVDGMRTEPYVYVESILTGGSGNTIQIAALENVNSFPVEIPLISYETATANFVVELPEGLFGFVQDNPVNRTIDVIISTTTPRTLIWTGNVNGNWDTTTENWVDSETQAPANFNQGDFVLFDDTAGVTQITVINSIIPGQSPDTPGIEIRGSKDYSFAGGALSGTGRIVKSGTGALTINLPSQPPLIINEGSVEVTPQGAVGTTTVQAGATFISAGTMNGGLTSSGTASNEGTLEGPVSILAGHFANSGTITTTPGTMTLSSGTTFTNSQSGVVNVHIVSGNNWSVPSDCVLANFGSINNLNGRLNINSEATLFGTGIVADHTDDINLNTGRLGLNGGSTFSPGEAPENSIGTFVVEGRLDLNRNARLVIDVDLEHPDKHDVVGVDKWSNIRGIIVMNNIGSVPFAAGQSFHIARNNFGLPNTPETAHLDYSIVPATPGPGLEWDDNQLIIDGILSIVQGGVNSTPPNFNYSFSDNALTLSWPESHIGWQLQEQTENLSRGISNINADWSMVPDTDSVNEVTIPIDESKQAGFYRLILP